MGGHMDMLAGMETLTSLYLSIKDLGDQVHCQ